METIYVVTYDTYDENDGWSKCQKFYKNVDCAVEYATKMVNHNDNHYTSINIELKEIVSLHEWDCDTVGTIYITKGTLYICDDIKDVDISPEIM